MLNLIDQQHKMSHSNSLSFLLTLCVYADGGRFPPRPPFEHLELICPPIVLVVSLQHGVEAPPVVDVLRRRVLKEELEHPIVDLSVHDHGLEHGPLPDDKLHHPVDQT